MGSMLGCNIKYCIRNALNVKSGSVKHRIEKVAFRAEQKLFPTVVKTVLVGQTGGSSSAISFRWRGAGRCYVLICGGESLSY